MGIKEDAGKILLFVYQEYMRGNDWIVSKDLIDNTKWESGRINRAIDYLRDLKIIKILLSLGNTKGVYNFGIRGLEPIGIDIVENSKLFEEKFGFKVENLESFKIKW